MQDAGIAYAVEQIVDLISNGVQGIHLYTMNNPDVAKQIAEQAERMGQSVEDFEKTLTDEQRRTILAMSE